MGRSITWPELIMLMVFGRESEDSIAGEILSRDVVPLAEGEELAPGELLIDYPGSKRAVVREWGQRVYRRGELARYEDLNGRVLRIDGESTRWMRYRGEEVFTAQPRGNHRFASPIGGLEVGGERPSLSRWEGADFTRPNGAALSVEFLGRAAWAVELAPPSRKPYPLQLVVDAATGLILRSANAGFGTFTQWTTLELDAELPDQLFRWDGPATPPEDRMAEHERDIAQRQEWLAARGIAAALTVPMHLMPHEWDDETGSIYASVELQLSGTLLRRAASDSEWPEVGTVHYSHSYRWGDGRWDWFLGSDQSLDDGQLAALRAQLARSS